MDDSGDAKKHVIFGTGQVGRWLCRFLSEDGHQVSIVSRSGVSDPDLEIFWHRGDALDGARVKELCAGADVVYNCLSAPYDKWATLFPPMQFNLIEGAAQAGASLISLENLYMYGRSNGVPLTEDTPFNPNSKKGEVRAKMAEGIKRVHDEGKVKTASLRPSDYFGPEVLLAQMGERVFYPVANGGKAQVVGKTTFLHTQTYVPDVARALSILGTREEALGKAWLAPSPETLTVEAFIQKAADMAGTQVGIQSAPKVLLTVLGLFNPIMRELKEMLYSWEEDWVVDHSKFEAAFGDIVTPLDEAMRTTIEWFRTNQPK